MTDRFDATADEQRLADDLDAMIDAALRTETSSDAVVHRLTALHRAPLPRTLNAEPRVRRVSVQRTARAGARRPERVAQLAALILGVSFFNHAFSNIFLGEWVADIIDGHYEPHVYNEGGVALAGLAILLLAAVRNKRWLGLAAVSGGSVGVGLGVLGIPEIVSLKVGGALHITEGLAGIVLLITWWRYARGPNPEGET